VGTDLDFRLLFEESPDVLLVRKTMTTELKPHRARILVVDDVQDAADILRILLEAEGHEVRVAINGRDALIVAQVFKPDIAVLDLGMPVMDGFELACHLRTAHGDELLHLVALTGRDDRKTKSAIVVMGALSRSGLKRLFIGNTAESLLDTLPCDFLIVKPAQFSSEIQRQRRGPHLAAVGTTPWV
jgi:CheY-like chemotaxis protein